MIEVLNLTKQYGKHTAVNNISFSLKKGEILGFLGPNGAGKSTTMNILTGYLSSTSGSIKVNGIDLLENPVEAKKHIGYLPEIPPLYVDMTVNEYLVFVANLKKVPTKEQAAHLSTLIAELHLEEVRYRLIKNLSKGYKQRVGLAQALIGSPEVLILDEPTVGLDPKQIIEMRELIKSLSKDHTILLSSHILSEISAICDQIMIINKGSIVASDTPAGLAQLFNATSHLTLRVPSPCDDLLEALHALPQLIQAEIIGSFEENTCDISLEMPKDTDLRPDIFRLCVQTNKPILLLQLSKTSLEDIFMQVTEGAMSSSSEEDSHSPIINKKEGNVDVDHLE